MASPILITGARGRLGSALSDYLQSRRREVVRFSRSAGEGCLILDDLFLADWLNQPVTLVHCAWSTVPKISETHPGIEWDTDFPLLWKILRAISESPDPARCRLIFMSSGGTVYGNAGANPSQESDPLKPLGWHGFAKTHAEGVIQRFAQTHGIQETRVRLSNPFGFVGPLSKPQGVIPFLIRAAMERSRFDCWGDGSAVKDYIALSDLVEGLAAIIDSPITGPVNLCAGQSFALHEIRELIEREAGVKIDFQHHAAPTWDVTDSRLDPSLLTKKTGWAARISIDNAIREMIAQLRSHT